MEVEMNSSQNNAHQVLQAQNLKIDSSRREPIKLRRLRQYDGWSGYQLHSLKPSRKNNTYSLKLASLLGISKKVFILYDRLQQMYEINI